MTTALISLSVLAFAALAYERRWIADDGMIAVRTARQIVAGHGPVYSPSERAETNTSTLWTWLLALGGWVTHVDIARIAVYGGLLLSVVGAAIALSATKTFHERVSVGRADDVERGAPTPSGWVPVPVGDDVPRGGVRGGETPRGRVLVPAGFLVVLGVSPFWDYATSGLESGLAFFWIALCWWLLVKRLASGPATRYQYTAAVVFGLGPLVRPEFALIGGVFAVAAWLLLRPGVRRTVGLLAAAGALPALYEVFRAGYYGTLVPLPALAKSAGGSVWGRGFTYMEEFAGGYALWVPLTVLAAALAVYADRRVRFRTERILLAAPLAAGLVLCLYVLRVGGDFMHARMLLPVTFLLLLPVLLLPWTKRAVPVIAVVAVWSAAVAVLLPVNFIDKAHATSEDERIGSQEFTGARNPDSSAPYLSREKALTRFIAAERAAGVKVLTSEGGLDVPLDPALPFGAGVIAGRLGAAGAATPLDDTVIDTLGLANPLGARITVTNPGRPGHEKVLPWAWILADYGDPAVVDNQVVIQGVPPSDVRAARHAMGCGALKELLDSARAPMTAGRFWDNLTGSAARTTLVVPADPVAAEKKFCG